MEKFIFSTAKKLLEKYTVSTDEDMPAPVQKDEIVIKDHTLTFSFDVYDMGGAEPPTVTVTLPSGEKKEEAKEGEEKKEKKKEEEKKVVVNKNIVIFHAGEPIQCTSENFITKFSDVLAGLEETMNCNLDGDGDGGETPADSPATPFPEDDSDEGFGDEEEDEGEEDEVFLEDAGTPVPEKEIQKVKYVVYTPKKLREMQDVSIKKVAELMYIDNEQAKIVLRGYRWDLDRIQRIFTDKFKDGVLQEVGLSAELFEAKDTHVKPDDEYECPVCLDDVKIKNTSILPACGHRFCDICWNLHITYKIKDGLSKRIDCMHSKCSCVLTDSIVEKFMKEKDLLEKYKTKVLESFVIDNDKMKWCQSAPHCGNSLLSYVPKKTPEEVTCDCGHRFCFSCLHPPHLPSSCTMAFSFLTKKKTFWRKKCSDDSENLNWIKANTRTCPVCKEIVLKDGGCNHISCKCGGHWCWACGKVFKKDVIYNHGCNMFKEPDDIGDETSQAALDHFNHYNTHFTSLKNQEKSKKVLDEKMKEMGKFKSWSEIQWIENSMKVLLFTRGVMMHCYVFAFYLFAKNATKDALAGCITFKDDTERKNRKEVFEMTQAQVEASTERLNAILDKDLEEILKHKNEVIKLTTLNEKKAHALFDMVKGKDGTGMVHQEEYMLPDPLSITVHYF